MKICQSFDALRRNLPIRRVEKFECHVADDPPVCGDKSDREGPGKFGVNGGESKFCNVGKVSAIFAVVLSLSVVETGDGGCTRVADCRASNRACILGREGDGLMARYLLDALAARECDNRVAALNGMRPLIST